MLETQIAEEAKEVSREQVIKGLVIHATELTFYPVSWEPLQKFKQEKDLVTFLSYIGKTSSV